MHVQKEKRGKMDAKVKKCILVSYSDKQKGYKFYNLQTKQVRVSRDVLFDESASWYLPSSPTPDNSIRISEDEISEAELLLNEDKIRVVEESSISFWLRSLNERLSSNYQLDGEPTSSGDCVVQSSCRKPRSWLSGRSMKQMPVSLRFLATV